MWKFLMLLDFPMEIAQGISKTYGVTVKEKGGQQQEAPHPSPKNVINQIFLMDTD